MTIKKFLISSATGILLFGSIASSAFAAGFTNGSFEAGSTIPSSPGYLNVASVDSSSIIGWTVSSGNIDYIGSYWTAANGNNSLDMNGTNSDGAISQTFDAMPGYTYVVTFDMSGNPDGGQGTMTMNVSAGNNQQSYSYLIGPTNSHTNMNWKPETFTFKANSSSTILTFTSTSTVSSFGPALDNVNVMTEPSSFADCSGNGYKSFVNSDGKTFANAGLCIAFVAQNLHQTNGNVSYSTNPSNTARWSVANDGASTLSAIGAFSNTDSKHGWYVANIQYLNVLGNTAWFAGPVTIASDPANNHKWVVVEAIDNSPDMIGVVITDSATAKNDVEDMTSLSTGDITSGNLTVH